VASAKGQTAVMHCEQSFMAESSGETQRSFVIGSKSGRNPVSF